MKHNHIAIVLTVVANQIIGFLWYSPTLFFDRWSAGFGLDPENINQADPTPFVLAIVSAFVAAYALSWLIQRLDIMSGWGGLQIGVIIWFAFMLGAIWPHYAFGGLPHIVALIDGLNGLASMAVTGFILGAWQKK